MDTAEIPPYYADWIRSEGIVSVGCVPIVHNGVLIATLNMGSHTRNEFSRMARLALEAIAMQIGGGLARVQAEETLLASRANLQTLFDAMDDMVLVVDTQGKILHNNPAVEKRLGYTGEELRRMAIGDVHPPELQRELAESLSQILSGRQSLCRIPFLTKDGERIPVESRVVLGQWAGQPVGFGVARDLSEREASRKALEESEARFRAIYDNSSVGIGLTDIDGNILDVNDAIAKIAGMPREEIVGHNFREFTTPEEGERQVNSFRDILEGRSDIYESENRYFRKDGTPFWVRCTSFKVPVADGETSRYIISLVENIDARKQAEESLRESESRYRLITDNVDDVVWSARWTPPENLSSFDPRALLESAIQGWRFEFISPSVERLFGFTVEECLADMPQYRRVPETFPEIVEDVLNELFGHGGGAVRRTFEIPLYTKTGTQRWCEITLTILPAEPDQSFRAIGILRDITARREIREALRKSEAQFRGLFRNMPDLVLLVDHTGAIRYVNHHTPTVPPETLLGGNAFNFVQAAYRERAKATFDRALATKEAQNVEAVSIFGTYWLFRIVPMYLEGVLDHVMAICTDVTAERKAAQELLKEQQLLRQMIDLQERERRFLSYEIHDGFAQQITGALFHIEAFQRLRKDEPEQAEKNLEQSASLLSRSIDETRRLISGLRPPILDESGILAAVEYLVCEYRGRSEADIMFRHELRGTRFAPPLESAIFRIVQEGLTNATRHSRSDFVRVELNELDDRLQIVIFDEGVGFDPKAVPENRFGLRSIRERTRLLGGKLEIESSPGEGCTIRVELPFVPGTEQNSD
jgi:PAS domain S-box-containing protein